MKNIYECYECDATSEFQLICHNPDRSTVLWMAPESGVHNVSEIIHDFTIDNVHFVLIPTDCEINGLLWQKHVCAKQRPDAIGMVGKNVIIDAPYDFGMFVKL
jgi:hypothetical protein